jgi:DNA-binding YbaB/EbfC family protein
MKDLSKLMKQAQELQEKMAKVQNDLVAMEIESSSGGGLVVAIMNGKSELKRIKIDPSLLKADEIEVLEDLIVAAHNDAKQKVEQRAAEEMTKVTSGIPLPPGMKLPF